MKVNRKGREQIPTLFAIAEQTSIPDLRNAKVLPWKDQQGFTKVGM